MGGTATQISGPTGPMTVVSAMVIAAAIEISGSLQAGMGIIIATFLLAGGFQILLGLLKIGKYIKYMPYPVLSGFMTGIGIIIILFQIYPFMGHKSAKSTIKILTQINEPLSSLNWMAIGFRRVNHRHHISIPENNKSCTKRVGSFACRNIDSIFFEAGCFH